MDNEELKTARRAEAGCLGFALFLLAAAMFLCLISIDGSALCLLGGLALLIVGGICLMPCFDLHRAVKELEKEAMLEDKRAEQESEPIVPQQVTETLNYIKPATIHIVPAVKEETPATTKAADLDKVEGQPKFVPRPLSSTAKELEDKLRELEEKIKGV